MSNEKFFLKADPKSNAALTQQDSDSIRDRAFHRADQRHLKP
jgi:hypothetical protein